MTRPPPSSTLFPYTTLFRSVYGLIRQESRFILDARSGVGASGLMQLMPATAKWTARKIGLPYTPALIADRDTNLRLGKDRKSTRLNSSHRCISYAVFCLKKK